MVNSSLVACAAVAEKTQGKRSGAEARNARRGSGGERGDTKWTERSEQIKVRKRTCSVKDMIWCLRDFRRRRRKRGNKEKSQKKGKIERAAKKTV
jgi:hypothetical protein